MAGKSKTSSSVKYRWIKEHYKSFSVYIDKADGEKFAELCKMNGDKQADILRHAIYDYLGEPVPPSKAKF